jgi:hypothetical protein
MVLISENVIKELLMRTRTHLCGRARCLVGCGPPAFNALAVGASNIERVVKRVLGVTLWLVRLHVQLGYLEGDIFGPNG